MWSGNTEALVRLLIIDITFLHLSHYPFPLLHQWYAYSIISAKSAKKVYSDTSNMVTVLTQCSMLVSVLIY